MALPGSVCQDLDSDTFHKVNWCLYTWQGAKSCSSFPGRRWVPTSSGRLMTHSTETQERESVSKRGTTEVYLGRKIALEREKLSLLKPKEGTYQNLLFFAE